ncbi:Dehydrogenase/reductase SDR family member 4 [Hondaea fermentalgiana]|uniref:Dehydrogenase/reductase SDR family member 4 n=1 Tax=Hondaea fermentalgiana TaxID=2315210 RepID=A0A2R5G6B0_9STRA|nr:Dehydrogenase/reductase SDR family member 4 [Hondaea fermentalgiana]|eukprot:GBG26530.1 Dehydrogenase/reductase SDR family member 4 [Hondaea fermentalgiana]
MAPLRGDEVEVPDTLRFVTEGHEGERTKDMNVVVFGGSSGIGFATAAMAVQECASRVLLVAQNERQLEAAAKVLRELGDGRAGCEVSNALVVDTFRANVAQRDEVTAALQAASAHGDVHAIVNTAGIAGYIGVSLGDVPDDIFFSKFDPVLNNLYGSMFISAEALRMWKLTGEDAPGPGFVPRLVHLSSEEALMPCPGCDLYGISKSGIVSLTRSLAAFYEGQLSVNVVAPGLVDTPLTWNQARGSKLSHNGTVLEQVDQMQTYQCYADESLREASDASMLDKEDNRRIIQDGTCQGGGTGLGCPCEDIRAKDPRLPLKYGEHLWPPIDPRDLGDMMLHLLSPAHAATSGETFVVDNNMTHVSSSRLRWSRETPTVANEFLTTHLVKSCPRSMVELCPSAVKFVNPHQFGPLDLPLDISHLIVLIVGLLLGRFFFVRPLSRSQSPSDYSALGDGK